MSHLANEDLLYLLSQLCIALVFARVFGEIFRRLRQPSVVGEIIGGILLGPTVLKHLSPGSFQNLFLSHPNATMSMDGIYSISVVMLLFISGMEIELPMVWKNGKTATIISFVGMTIPLGIGFATGWFGYGFLSGGPENYKLVFSLFMGTAFAITALPVIAKILFDLNLLNSKIGSLIISCAMLTDFVGWNLFSVVLSMMPNTEHHLGHFAIWQTALMTIGFAILVLTLVKYIINRTISFVNRQFKGPGGSVTIAMSLCFAAAIFTEYIGIHAVFGAFLMGIAFGESIHFAGRSKEIIHQFVANIFAPLFFISIGLKVDFIGNFDLGIFLIILVVAFITKIMGGYLGGRLGGLRTNESLAIGFGINARGAMEIMLGLIALQAHLIDEKIFVSLTLMAIITSISSGYFIKYFLKRDELRIRKV